MTANHTWDWKCDVCHYHTSAYNTFSLICNVIYTQVMKHEYENNTFLFVIILPMLRAVTELTWNWLVAQEWANSKWKENLRGILKWNCSFEAWNNNAMITLNLMSRIYGTNKPWRTEHNGWLSSFSVYMTENPKPMVDRATQFWKLPGQRMKQWACTTNGGHKKWHTEMVPNTIISS